MIELTEKQAQALTAAGSSPLRVMNPRTQETYVLLPQAEYDRLKQEAYDDSPWTRPDLEAVAWETAQHEAWEEYDDPREKP